MTEEDWDHERFTLESIKLRETWYSYSLEQKRRTRISELAKDFPTKYQASALALLQTGFDASEVVNHQLKLENIEAMADKATEDKRQEREWKREGRAFWAGVGFLFVALAVGLIFSKSLSTTSIKTVRIFTGIGVALVIAFLPGMFSMDTNIVMGKSKILIKATGGLAGFAIVYLIDPGWISGIFSHLK
jgi:hypothetical protein